MIGKGRILSVLVCVMLLGQMFVLFAPPTKAAISPFDISAHKSADDIVLDWTTGTGPFGIYISDSVDGSGPYVLLADGIAGTTYTHVGALADDFNHSYYVSSDGGLTKSNLAFKLCRPLCDNGLALNWITLPYKTDLVNADDLMDDINLHGPGGDTAYIVTRWNINTPMYESRTDLGAIRIGVNFALTPGESYQVKTYPGKASTWKIVGANQDIGTDITIELPNNSLDYQWIGLPYNTGFANAGEVMDQINIDGSGGISCDKLTEWYELSQGYNNYLDIGIFRIGQNFEVRPGYGYQVHTTEGHENPAWVISQNTLEP